jgi:hypothetical protein
VEAAKMHRSIPILFDVVDDAAAAADDDDEASALTKDF